MAAEMDVPPQGIGLGFSGAVDPAVGVVMLPGKLQLEGFPTMPRLAEATGVPMIADNDGRLSILAEAAYGQARAHRWAVTITLAPAHIPQRVVDGADRHHKVACASVTVEAAYLVPQPLARQRVLAKEERPALAVHQQVHHRRLVIHRPVEAL